MTNLSRIRRPAAILIIFTAAGASYAATSPSMEAFAKLPLNFEVNQGQADPQAAFVARGMGYTVFLTKNDAVLALPEAGGEATNVLRMSLAGANPNPVISGVQPLPGHSNYLIGNDRAKWRTNVPSFGKVRYEAAYPGIDLVYYGNQGELEYDFVVAPGSDPSRIRLRFAGARGIKVAPDGDLVLQAGSEEIHFRRPVVYQTSAEGLRTELDGRFALLTSNEVGFQLAHYDRSRALVIDPAIVRSTFLGGKGKDIGYSIAVDSQGLVYVTGSTTSVAGFPAPGCFQCPPVNGPMDAFVTKFIPTGAGFVYSTYLGGSGSDAGFGIATDGRGNAYVTGETNSPNFPLAGPAMLPGGGLWDAFVTALNPVGFPIYSTYLGGNGTDIGYGIAADPNGDAYVTGFTTSPNFPVLTCFQCVPQGGDDAFVTSFNPGGALRFSTYLGGHGNDIGYGISVDANEEIGVTGSTGSHNFPVIACAQCASGGGLDAFASALIYTPGPPSLALKWSTYWGGASNDAGFGIVMDSVGEAWITGYTDSVNFPITANCVQCVNGGGQDAIVVRFQVTAAAFSDYLGGQGADTGRAITEGVPATGGPVTAYLTGDTTSLNFPLVACIAGVGCANNGLDDAFVAAYTLGGGPIRVYSTYLGGVKNDAGRGIALGPYGAYVTGGTGSANFPIAAPCTQCVFSGGVSDAFVTVIH